MKCFLVSKCDQTNSRREDNERSKEQSTSLKYVKHLYKYNTQGRYSALFYSSEGPCFYLDFLVAVSVYWDGSILITRRNTRECCLKLYSRLLSRTVSAWLNPFKSFPTHLHLQTESSKDLPYLPCMTQCLQQALTTNDLKRPLIQCLCKHQAWSDLNRTLRGVEYLLDWLTWIKQSSKLSDINPFMSGNE